jgi:hypothetical protein
MGDLAAAARLAVLGMVAMIALACALLLIVRLLTDPRGTARA